MFPDVKIAARNANQLMQRLDALIGDVLESAAKSWREKKTSKPIGQVAQGDEPEWRGQEDVA
jgi:hypothetical protein